MKTIPRLARQNALVSHSHINMLVPVAPYAITL